LRDTANPRIEIYNGGWGGSNSINWTDTTTTVGYNAYTMLSASYLNPTMTFNNLGINDWNSPQTAISTYATNQGTLQTRAKSTGGNVFLFGTQSNPASFASVETQQAYGDATRALAQAGGDPWFNYQYRWTNYATANGLGFMADDRHPTAYGYQDQAGFLMSAVRRLVG